MTEDIRDSYIAGLDPKWAPLLLALDKAIMAARPDFGRRVAYGLLMYTLGGDTRHWVCAIGVTKKGANLKLLWGVLLSDPRKLLRPGTSHLMSVDFPTLESVDAQLIAGYVTEAIAKLEYGKEHEKELQPSTPRRQSGTKQRPNIGRGADVMPSDPRRRGTQP